jgi:hypothetical protein
MRREIPESTYRIFLTSIKMCRLGTLREQEAMVFFVLFFSIDQDTSEMATSTLLHVTHNQNSTSIETVFACSSFHS